MKSIEEKLKELELEFSILKSKLKLQDIELKDTSHYLNNYTPAYSPSVNLLSTPELETSFASPWDSFEIKADPSDYITVSLSSICDDTIYNDKNIEDIYEFPSYPDIIGSWDSLDLVSFNQMDNIPPYEDNNIIGYLTPSETKMEKELGKIRSKFRILHHEWEMDGYGYILDTKEGKQVTITNHGRPMFANKDYLENLIKLYKEVIQETERALFLIK